MVASDKDFSFDREAVPDLVPIQRAEPQCASHVESAEIGKKNGSLPSAETNSPPLAGNRATRTGSVAIPYAETPDGTHRGYQNQIGSADLISTNRVVPRQTNADAVPEQQLERVGNARYTVIPPVTMTSTAAARKTFARAW
jgi:hypothetical protein